MAPGRNRWHRRRRHPPVRRSRSGRHRVPRRGRGPRHQRRPSRSMRRPPEHLRRVGQWRSLMRRSQNHLLRMPPRLTSLPPHLARRRSRRRARRRERPARIPTRPRRSWTSSVACSARWPSDGRNVAPPRPQTPSWLRRRRGVAGCSIESCNRRQHAWRRCRLNRQRPPPPRRQPQRHRPLPERAFCESRPAVRPRANSFESGTLRPIAFAHKKTGSPSREARSLSINE